MKISAYETYFNTDDLVRIYVNGNKKLTEMGIDVFDDVSLEDLLGFQCGQMDSFECFHAKKQLVSLYKEHFKNDRAAGLTICLYEDLEMLSTKAKYMSQNDLIERFKHKNMFTLYVFFYETVAFIRLINYELILVENVETKTLALQTLKDKKAFLEKVCGVINSIYGERKETEI